MKTKSMYVIGNELYLGPYLIRDLAGKYKTPLYVYDEQQIIENILTFKNNFNSSLFDCHIVYASKAFLVPYLVSIINKYDLYIDSVSLGDLFVLKKCNFPFERIVFHGNNKSLEELNYALENKVGLIVVDNIYELETLSELVSERKQVVKTLFRVNPHIQTTTHQYIQTSHIDSKFGESIYNKEKINKIALLYKQNPYLKLCGFHAHIGSQIKDLLPYLYLVKTMANFISEFEKEFHIPIDILNLGGGFGIKYLDDEQKFPLEEGLKQIILEVEQEIIKKQIHIKQLMIEPGRSIVGNAGFSLYTISQLKITEGKKFLFVDGGMTDNIRPALYQAKYTHDIVSKMNQPKDIECDIVGKCCESGDIVATDTKVCYPEKGDILIVYNTGAYGYSMSSNYNNLMRPAVIFINDNQIYEAVYRETFEDLIKTFNFNGVNYES